jgi:hypothetical protein
MSFLLSSFQFDRKDVDHNLLLRKSFRENRNFCGTKAQVGLRRPRFGFSVSHAIGHTQTNKRTDGRTPLNERLARRRDYNPPNTKKFNRRKFMLSALFDPAISPIRLLQTQIPDRTAIEVGEQ